MIPFNNDEPGNREPLDHSSAAVLLSRHLPYVSLSKLQAFGSGDFCVAFKLDDQVVRVARHLKAAAALRRETCVLAEIAEMMPLPVPRPTYYSPPACPPFTIHNEIVGDVLTRAIWENMPGLEREKATADLAAFLKTLHSIPVEIGLQCGLAQLDAAAMARRLHEASANTIHGFLDHKTQRQLDETLENWSLQSQPDRKPALLHCDIGPGHLFYDPQTGNLTDMIDFGDVAIGDPARDFIYIYEDFGPVILKQVLDSYAETDLAEIMFAIRKWYILEAISWTVQMCVEQRSTDMLHGLKEITRELATLPVR